MVRCMSLTVLPVNAARSLTYFTLTSPESTLISDLPSGAAGAESVGATLILYGGPNGRMTECMKERWKQVRDCCSTFSVCIFSSRQLHHFCVLWTLILLPAPSSLSFIGYCTIPQLVANNLVTTVNRSRLQQLEPHPVASLAQGHISTMTA